LCRLTVSDHRTLRFLCVRRCRTTQGATNIVFRVNRP
jgi:hypothetical protein